MRQEFKWVTGRAMRQVSKTENGFTLVELLIVVIIIAILAAMAIPKFTNASLRGRESALRGSLKQIRNGVDLFRQDTGYFPNHLSDLTSSTAPNEVKDLNGQSISFPNIPYKGPYLSQLDTDPVDGSSFSYSSGVGGNGVQGNVAANAGTAIDGTNYSTW
jgi:general secretion pathway protein G